MQIACVMHIKKGLCFHLYVGFVQYDVQIACVMHIKKGLCVSTYM